MLHFASTAKLLRPLAFDAGVLPSAATGVGVAQIHGMVCEPSRIGPPRSWFVIVRLAHGRPRPWPLASATNRFLPGVKPSSTPRSVRAESSATNDDLTSAPLSVSITLCIGTFFGTRTSTSASPSLIRSARLDNVRISKLNGGSCAPAPSADADDTDAPAPTPPNPATSSAVSNKTPIRVDTAPSRMMGVLPALTVDAESRQTSHRRHRHHRTACARLNRWRSMPVRQLGENSNTRQQISF